MNTIFNFFLIALGSKDPEGYKQSLKTKMQEWLRVGVHELWEAAMETNAVETLNDNGESLE